MACFEGNQPRRLPTVASTQARSPSEASSWFAFAEPNCRHCHFSLSGVEAESGDRAAAEDDRRTGRGGKQERAAAAALSDLFTPKARGLDQENTHRSPDSAFAVVSSVVLSVH